MEQKVKWAERVKPDLIRRLYKNDATNIQDNELADEVGYGLYVRAQDYIKVNIAHESGIVYCPSCNDEIRKDAEDMYICQCGWNISQKMYHATYKRKQYVGSSVVPFAEKFIADWQKAQNNYFEKMRAIDYLIHCFHWEMTECATRPAAINFIEGNLSEIIELILELAYDNDKAEYKEQMERWLKNAKKSAWLCDRIFNKKEEIEKLF